MPTKDDQDTDPSTPIARRSSAPPRNKPSTHPGVGPPKKLSNPPPRPLGVVVPAPSRPPPRPDAPSASEKAASEKAASENGSKKDSVELLLGGMGEPVLERRKTTPQTDGQASASYHSEHAVAPPGPRAMDEMASVLVDRPPAPITVRVARARELLGEGAGTESTVVTPTSSSRRVIVAVVAGMMVVLGIFVTLQFAGHSPTASAPPSPSAAPSAVAVAPEGANVATAVSSVAAVAAASATAVANGGATPTVTTGGVPTAATASVTTGGAPTALAAATGLAGSAVGAAPARSPTRSTPAGVASTPRRRDRAASSAASAPAPGDLGEFKTTY